MSYLRSNKTQLGAVIVLAALLFTLAVFQYNWLGELSERNQQRMQDTVDWATRAVRWNFDGELGDLYRTFQVDFREEQAFEAQLAARYAERINTIEGPDILERIYWVNLDDEAGLEGELVGAARDAHGGDSVSDACGVEDTCVEEDVDTCIDDHFLEEESAHLQVEGSAVGDRTVWRDEIVRRECVY